MNAKLAAIPGIELTFSQVIEDNVNEAISGVKGFTQQSMTSPMDHQCAQMAAVEN